MRFNKQSVVAVWPAVALAHSGRATAQWSMPATPSHRGEIIERVDLENSFSSIVLKLHAQLLMGPCGALLVGFSGLCFLVSLLTGVIIYGPMMKRFAFGLLRRERHARTLLADLHKLLGAATFGWNLVVVATDGR